jgi:hypothetical protein
MDDDHNSLCSLWHHEIPATYLREKRRRESRKSVTFRQTFDYHRRDVGGNGDRRTVLRGLKKMTENVEQIVESNDLEKKYLEWAEDWENYMPRGQLTHIRVHPAVEMFVSEGKKAIPFILERMKEKRLWFLPLEKIILNEYDEEIKPDEKTSDNTIVEDDPVEAKFANLEGYRTACFNWARKNKYLPEE